MHVAMSNPEPTFGRPVQYPAPRLRHEGLDANHKNLAVLIHVAPFAALVLAPLIIAPLFLWLIKKDESSFVDDHGREAINFLISSVIWAFGLSITVVGLIALPVLVVLVPVNMIRGAVAASNGEYFRYPFTIRMIS